jgi:hypothetical protein
VTDLVAYGQRVLRELREDGVEARALGGVAVALRCPSARFPPLARDYNDLDLVTDGEHANQVSAALTSNGFTAAERFNRLHGHSRMMFTGPEGVHVDLIVGEFVMCHRLSLKRRLFVDQETISLGDLLLTKLQIAELNAKDVSDVTALLVDHPLTDDETGVNRQHIAALLSSDWGWWRTATGNLELIKQRVPSLGLPAEETGSVMARFGDLQQAIAARKRSVRWRLRSRLGERVPWRFDPEEVTL